jgi:hypothetical protein
MKLSICVLAAALVGCASGPTVWQKAYATQADLDADVSRCRYEAQLATASSNDSVLGQTFTRNKLFRACMGAKGYTLQR